MDSAPTFSIRPATEDDLSQLEAIEKRVHVAPWNADHFRAELVKPYSRLWVLTDDETDSVIAGYVVFWEMFEDCQILNIAVDLPFRGQGYAKQMVRKVVQHSVRQGLKKIVLEVRRSNAAALHLYQTVGLTIRQIRRQFYSDGEDAYEMALDLSDLAIDF